MANAMIPGCRFLHLALYVSDFERSLSFYTGHLGFTVKAQWGEPGRRTALLDFGNGTGLELFERDVRKETPDTACTGAYWHYALQVDDVEAAYERAIAGGATVRSEPYDANIASVPHPMLARIAFVFGPDGELIEFYKFKDAEVERFIRSS